MCVSQYCLLSIVKRCLSLLIVIVFVHRIEKSLKSIRYERVFTPVSHFNVNAFRANFVHRMGRRGRNHHDDDDYNKDLDLSKLSFYDEDNNNDDEEEEEPADEDEIYNRGRSRSRSIHELDSAPLSADAVIAQHNIVDPPSSSEVSKLKPPEKSGPLNNKEILALKKVIQDYFFVIVGYCLCVGPGRGLDAS